MAIPRSRSQVRKVGGVSSSGETTIIGTPGNDVIRIASGSASLHSDLQAGKDLDDDTDLVLESSAQSRSRRPASTAAQRPPRGGRSPSPSSQEPS